MRILFPPLIRRFGTQYWLLHFAFFFKNVLLPYSYFRNHRLNLSPVWYHCLIFLSLHSTCVCFSGEINDHLIGKSSPRFSFVIYAIGDGCCLACHGEKIVHRTAWTQSKSSRRHCSKPTQKFSRWREIQRRTTSARPPQALAAKAQPAAFEFAHHRPTHLEACCVSLLVGNFSFSTRIISISPSYPGAKTSPPTSSASLDLKRLRRTRSNSRVSS